MEDVPARTWTALGYYLGSYVSNSNALYPRLRHPFHLPPASSICKRTRNICPYILTRLPDAHAFPPCAHKCSHTHMYTHTCKFRQQVPGPIYSVHPMVIDYLLCRLPALPKISHRKAWPDLGTHAQLHNQMSTPYTTQVRDMCFLIPIPTQPFTGNPHIWTLQQYTTVPGCILIQTHQVPMFLTWEKKLK